MDITSSGQTTALRLSQNYPLLKRLHYYQLRYLLGGWGGFSLHFWLAIVLYCKVAAIAHEVSFGEHLRKEFMGIIISRPLCNAECHIELLFMSRPLICTLLALHNTNLLGVKYKKRFSRDYKKKREHKTK